MDTSEFDITVDDGGLPVVVIRLLCEDATVETATRLNSAVQSEIDRGQRRIVFDCRAVKMFGSGVIGIVVTAHNSMQTSGAIALVGSPRHLEVVKMCRMQGVIPAFEELDPALASVRGDGPAGPGAFDVAV